MTAFGQKPTFVQGAHSLSTKPDLATHDRLLKLNAEMPMKIARVFSQQMVSRGRGGIIFTSSLFGYQGIPYLAHYAATKAYILTLGEALNIELAPYGVDVTVLSPGLTKTELSENMRLDFPKMPVFNMSPRIVAQVGLSALGKKASVVPGFLNKFFAWQNRLIPRIFPVKLFGFLIRRSFEEKAVSSLLLEKKVS